MTIPTLLLSSVALTSAAAAITSFSVHPNTWTVTGFLMVGSSLGVLCACFSKERIEQARMTRARIITGVVGGVGLPRFMQWCSKGYFWQFILEEIDPIVVIFIGFLCSYICFYVMHAALRKIESRENAIGGAIVKTIEKKAGLETQDEEEKK